MPQNPTQLCCCSHIQGLLSANAHLTADTQLCGVDSFTQHTFLCCSDFCLVHAVSRFAPYLSKWCSCTSLTARSFDLRSCQQQQQQQHQSLLLSRQSCSALHAGPRHFYQRVCFQLPCQRSLAKCTLACMATSSAPPLVLFSKGAAHAAHLKRSSNQWSISTYFWPTDTWYAARGRGMMLHAQSLAGR